MRKLYKGLIPLCLLLCVSIVLSAYSLRIYWLYDYNDVQVINRVVEKSGFEHELIKNNPESWGHYVVWDTSALPMRVLYLRQPYDFNGNNPKINYGVMDFSTLTGLYSLSWYSHEDFARTEALILPENLRYLDCENNGLKHIDFSRAKNLISIYCRGNELTEVDLSGLKEIQDVDCSDNQLTSLILPEDAYLLTLNCSNNQITGLDLSKQKNLYGLNCSYNAITRLDVAPVEQMKNLSCHHNPMQELKLDGLRWISRLQCYDEGDLSIGRYMPIAAFDYSARTITLKIEDKFAGCYVDGYAVGSGNLVHFALTPEQLSDGVMIAEPFEEYKPEIYANRSKYQDNHTIVMKEAV